MVLEKYLYKLHDPENGSTLHFPIAVASQSQEKLLSWQNYAPSQLSILRKEHPFPFPQVEGSA